MNKIEQKRVGYDGNSNTVAAIATWFVDSAPKDEIKDKLSKIAPVSPREAALIHLIKDNLALLLSAKPEALKKITENWKAKYGDILFDPKPTPIPIPRVDPLKQYESEYYKPTSFSGKLLDAFNYKKYRQWVFMMTLAQKLNVKACPYCNLHYTLYVQGAVPKMVHGAVVQKTKKVAKLQYDHFFSKTRYPFLSMSFYNLIPSCSQCNTAKSEKELPLELNPYHYAIHTLFEFQVNNEKDIVIPGTKLDHIQIDLVPKEPKNHIEKLKAANHIHLQYARMRDIVQEVYDKAYLANYYNGDEFKRLSFDYKVDPLRLLLGTYPDPEDIEKRPMSKFIQDIWKQATGKHQSLKPPQKR